MQQHSIRLAKFNAILKRKHFVSKRQSNQLKSDKTDLEHQINTKEQIIQQMHNCISHDPSVDLIDFPNSDEILSKSFISEVISSDIPVSI